MKTLGTAAGLAAFFALFDRKLTRNEAENLLGRKLVATETGFFSLHETKNETLDRFFRKGKQWARIAAFLPFVRGTAIANTVAMRAPDETSDIDLLIVTRKNRIWIARILVTALFSLFGVRRHEKKVIGRLCLSFFIDETAMEMQQIALPDGDPYLAIWTATLAPVSGKIWERFFAKNNEFLASYGLLRWNADPKLQPIADFFQSIFEFPLRGVIGDALERAIRTRLLPRAEKKRAALPDPSGIVLTNSMLKFHNADRRTEFRELWKNRITKR